jgi:sulfoxide reductase heme-binding subunit YedZ
VVTSLLRHRLLARLWRSVHWLAYLCWPVALAHGVGIGTDMRAAPGLALAAACALAGVGAALWRMSAPPQQPPADRAAAMLADLRAEQSRRPIVQGSPR